MSVGIKERQRLSRRSFAALLAGTCFVRACPAAAQTGSVMGDGGRLRLPVEAKRIVVLDAGFAGYALALGAPVVAADVRFPDGRINRRTGFPPLWSRQALAQKTTALPQHPDSIALDAIKAAAPDLIIAGGRNPGGALSRALASELSAIAPTLIAPATLPGWREELALIAEATGRADKAPALIVAFETRAKEVASKIALPDGEIALLQANAAGIHEDPFALSAGGELGRTLSTLGFEVFDAAARVAGGKPDANGRVIVPIAAVLEVFTAPNLIMVSNGPVSMGQLCCDPGYRQLDAVINYRRWELDESAVRPDYLSALRLLDMLEAAFPKKA
ncbi:hypothetical protein DK26_12940 [Bosea sp. WAO]|uniref:ABC transporter substrate-binding protein n=1 Tax=Bosea sp. WAO TaxID=406341 RepID=UPI00074A2F64|nr:ABC transporter substrate-binding protein [Bosea sp. WAO]KUL94973.1 hypothetical protein DK26_12940 [Bosea sp. WAO]